MDSSRNPGPRSRTALIARLRKWLKPPRILRPTRAGWCFFAIVFGVGFAALNTGNNLLYLMLSLLLSFLVLSGLLSESALRGITVERTLPREIFAGVDNPVLLRIHNRQKRVVSFAIVVEDQMRERGATKAAGRCFALRIGPGESEDRRYALRPKQRGHLRFSGQRVSTRFPFGLFAKSMLVEAPDAAVAYPAVKPLGVPSRQGSERHEGESHSRHSGHGAEVSGLREFQEGDCARRIHWRSSLRRGGLMVGEVDDDRSRQIEVLLRTQSATHDRDQLVGRHSEFERRVCRAASEIVCHLDAGSPVALRTDREYIPPSSGAHHRARLLHFLALVEQHESGAAGKVADPCGQTPRQEIAL